MNKGDKIIWNSGFGYDLGYYVSDESSVANNCVIELVSGLVHGEVSRPKKEIYPFEKTRYEMLVKAYGYVRVFPPRDENINKEKDLFNQ